jgi:hypothetical protein
MLTVRNIEMMCFRSKKLEHDGITDTKLRSVMSIYDEVSVKLTKSERKELRVWLERSQKLETGIIKLKKSELKDLVDIDGLFVAQSRKNIVRLLEYMTFIRELKIDNDQIDATAINGILFEGLSGSGKSYVAIKFLEHLGFRNAAKYPEATKKYYVITPTNFRNAEADLLRLVDEGAVILVDEINTMPLEDVLNPLLSGVDLQGEFAKKKGGFVIATQNPISYGNRLVFSEAVDKRFQKIIVKDFKKPELIEMLKSMINDETWNTWIETLVDYYLEAIQYTQKYNIPSPNLRQLTEYVDYAHEEFNIVPEEVKDIQEIAVIEEVDDNNQASLAMVPYDSAKALVYTIESTTLRAINMALDFRLPNIMLPQVIELVPSILLTSQVVSDVVAEDMVLTVRVDNGEFPDIFLPAGDGSAIRFTFFGDVFESFTTRLLENTAIKAYLLNYVYGENIVAVNAILSKSYIKDSQDSGVQEILQKSPFEWSKKDFNKINLIIHPDKGGDAEDFKIIQEFKESRGPQENLDDNLFTKAFEKFLPSMHQFISKATIGIKVFDTVIDGARLSYEPNITHAKAVALDTTYLYSMYTGVNGYSSSINLIDVSYKLYNGEYMGAIQQAAVIAAYMALPSVIAATGIPYVGLVYSSAMLGYTGYSAASNSYSFYQEFGSNDFYIKSYTAYKDVAKTLSDSLLQDFYDFKPLTKIYELNLKKLELNTQVLELKKEMQEDGSEFAQKLYKYIIEPQVERKYDLFNKVIQGIITEEQMEGLVLKVLEEIVVGTQSYNNCVEFEEQNYYCFNNKFVDHVIMGEGMDPLLIAHL